MGTRDPACSAHSRFNKLFYTSVMYTTCHELTVSLHHGSVPYSRTGQYGSTTFVLHRAGSDDPNHGWAWPRLR